MDCFLSVPHVPEHVTATAPVEPRLEVTPPGTAFTLQETSPVSFFEGELRGSSGPQGWIWDLLGLAT